LLLCAGYVSSTSLSRSSRSSGNCPVIVARSEDQCRGSVSECWAPGQYDVDCDNFADVCCFDGCANVCGSPKVCKTIIQTKYENVTKQMCQPVEQPPQCTSVIFEDCYDDCKEVDSFVPTLVEEDVCDTVFEPVCQDHETEICVPPVFEQKDPVCPIIHLKPVDQCVDEAPSNCWSPGVPDVDCQNNGLCCFNGCANRCVKNCHFEMVQDCITVAEDQCADQAEEICNDVEVSTPCEPDCQTVQEQVCKDVVEQVCESEHVSNCSIASIPVVKQVTEVVCVDKTVPSCTVVFDNVCTGSKVDSYKPYTCKKVPRQDCREVVVQECKDESKTVTEFIDKEVCEPYTRPVCAAVTRPDCQTVDREECVTLEGCTKVENKCETVVKKVCARVPREECRNVSKEVCADCVKKIVTSRTCSDVPKTVCTKETKTVNKPSSNEVCEKVCVPRTEELCTPVEPKTVCNTIVKQMSYPVPVLSCE
jgi:hypothetical protein